MSRHTFVKQSMHSSIRAICFECQCAVFTKLWTSRLRLRRNLIFNSSGRPTFVRPGPRSIQAWGRSRAERRLSETAPWSSPTNFSRPARPWTQSTYGVLFIWMNWKARQLSMGEHCSTATCLQLSHCWHRCVRRDWRWNRSQSTAGEICHGFLNISSR